MTTTIDVKAVVSVTKVRKGWQVCKAEVTGITGDGTPITKWVNVCWFVSPTEAYAYAWMMEHGI